MSGALSIVFMLLQVFASAHIQPSLDLHATVPMIGHVILSWNHREPRANSSSMTYMVRYETPEEPDNRMCAPQNHCTIPIIALHRGLKFAVASTMKDCMGDDFVEDNDTGEWVDKELSPYPGVEGTAVRSLNCELRLMSINCILHCDWKPGAKAPADTQYHFYYRFKKETVTSACSEYVSEPRGGRRTGCSVLLSSDLLRHPKEFVVHINGSSRSLEIQAFQKVFLSSQIEVLPPIPHFSFDKMKKLLKWAKPTDNFRDACFSYQVNFWSQDLNDTVTVKNVSFWRESQLGSSIAQHFRVRAVGGTPCWINERYSPWTDTISIDTGSHDMLGTTISICLTVACLAMVVLCIRYWRVFFPQIPKPRNDLKDAFQNSQSQALTRCNSWDNEEVISYIEEVGKADAYKDSLDYTQVGEYPGGSVCKTI